MVKPQGVPPLKGIVWKRTIITNPQTMTNLKQFLSINACNLLFASMGESKTSQIGKVLLGKLVKGRERGWKGAARKERKYERASEHTKHSLECLTRSFFSALAHLTLSPSPSEACHTGFAEVIHLTLKIRVLYCKGRCESTLHYRKYNYILYQISNGMAKFFNGWMCCYDYK